ncbi:MAG: hypothetical protein IJC07_01245 [Clostridia bacterium]|nr:hypothetical protein [Clostridia bacterium]
MEINKDRIKQTLEVIFDSVNGLVDVNRIIGEPICTPDQTFVVPVSKVTVGVLTGGGEYGKTKMFKNSNDLPYSAGNGAIITIKPTCFLVKEKDKYKLLSIAENSYEKLIDLTGEVFNGIIGGGEND